MNCDYSLGYLWLIKHTNSPQNSLETYNSRFLMGEKYGSFGLSFEIKEGKRVKQTLVAGTLKLH